MEGAFTGAIGGGLGCAVGKTMKVDETSTSSFLKTTMAESMEQTAKTIRQIGASTGQSQAVINANVDVVTETMKKGMANATKATNSTITTISAGSAMTTESTIKVIQQQQKKDYND